MNRIAYALADVTSARRIVRALKRVGFSEREIGLAARHDIELEELPQDLLIEPTDFAPAMARGSALGGTTGLVAGMIAAAIPPLGITLAGGALLLGVAGAAVGAWSAALMGSAMTNEMRQHFESLIERGKVLLVVDAGERVADVDAIVRREAPDAQLLETPDERASAA